MRAVKSQELKAFRDNKNYWKVDRSELNRWCASNVRTVEAAHTAHTQKDSMEALSKIASLEAENTQLRERLLETKEDRDAWREMVQRRRWWPFIK